MIRILDVNDRKIEYEITRKKVKNINMRISADSVVKVSASNRVTVAEIEKALLKNAEFIFKAQDKYRKAKENMPSPLRYDEGEAIYVFGKSYSIKLSEGANKALIKDDTFFISARDCGDFSLKEKIVQSFLRELAAQNITKWLNEIFPRFNQFDIPYPEISFRKMKSRWGSCHIQKKKIVFSTALVHKSEDFCRYVIIHELTHFIHPNHSKAFYDTITLFMSNYKEIINREKQI